MYGFPGLTVRCQVAGYMQLGGRELDIEQLGKYVGSVCLFFPMKVTGGHAYINLGKSLAPALLLLVNLRNRMGEERRRKTLCDERDNNFT